MSSSCGPRPSLPWATVKGHAGLGQILCTPVRGPSQDKRLGGRHRHWCAQTAAAPDLHYNPAGSLSPPLPEHTAAAELPPSGTSRTGGRVCTGAHGRHAGGQHPCGLAHRTARPRVSVCASSRWPHKDRNCWGRWVGPLCQVLPLRPGPWAGCPGSCRPLWAANLSLPSVSRLLVFRVQDLPLRGPVSPESSLKPQHFCQTPPSCEQRAGP